MADEHSQEQSGQPETAKTVADPLDPANSTNSGDVSPLSQFEEEIAEMAENGFQAVDEQAEAEPEESAPQPEADPDAGSDDPEEQPENPDAETPDDEGDDPEQPEAKAPDRFRFKSDEDKAVALLAKAKKISLVEAAKLYDGLNPEQQAQDSPSPQSSGPKESSSDLEKRIEALENEELEAIRLVDVDRHVEIKVELRELNKKVAEAKAQEATARQSEIASFEADFDRHCDKAYGAYPDLKDPNSALYKRVAELDNAAKQGGDPVFNSVSKLWDLGKVAAKELGIPMATTVAAPSSVAPPAQKKVTTFKPASSNARTSSVSPTQRTAQEIDSLDSVDAFESYVGAYAD